MIIGIDGNEANEVNRVGVNQYTFEVLWGIYKLQGIWSKKHRFIVYLKKEPISELPKAKKGYEYEVLPGGGNWIITKLTPRLLFGSPKPDVFFTPSHYVPPFSLCPRVCTIHDLGYLKFSGQFKKYDFWQLFFWSAYSIFISKKVIAVSNSTKSDIVRHYPFSRNKTVVTHEGYDSKIFNMQVSPEDVRRVKSKYFIVSDYVLFLGTLKPSKNIEGLLKAFGLVLSSFPDIKLVIAGKKGWLYEPIFRKVEELGLRKSVIFTDFVQEEDKPALIKGARLFVIPSFWEGFGLDALGAMACGIPVVASKVGGLPEVIAEAGTYVDPHDIDSIVEGLLKVLRASKTEYNKLVEAGLEQVKNFSWEKTAVETLKALESVK